MNFILVMHSTISRRQRYLLIFITRVKIDTTSPGSTHLKRGYGRAALNTPFHASPAIHKTPSWGISPFTRPSFERKSVTFPLQSKYFVRKYDNFQLQKLKFDHKFCQKAWKFCKISVLMPLISMKIRSQATTFMAIYPLTSPQVRKSGPHIPTRKKKKVECPPRQLPMSTVPNLTSHFHKIAQFPKLLWSIIHWFYSKKKYHLMCDYILVHFVFS